jgi:hypothetical protein
MQAEFLLFCKKASFTFQNEKRFLKMEKVLLVLGIAVSENKMLSSLNTSI